jgi:hypothetical protein
MGDYDLLYGEDDFGLDMAQPTFYAAPLAHSVDAAPAQQTQAAAAVFPAQLTQAAAAAVFPAQSTQAAAAAVFPAQSTQAAAAAIFPAQPFQVTTAVLPAQ